MALCANRGCKTTVFLSLLAFLVLTTAYVPFNVAVGSGPYQESRVEWHPIWWSDNDSSSKERIDTTRLFVEIIGLCALAGLAILVTRSFPFSRAARVSQWARSVAARIPPFGALVLLVSSLTIIIIVVVGDVVLRDELMWARKARAEGVSRAKHPIEVELFVVGKNWNSPEFTQYLQEKFNSDPLFARRVTEEKRRFRRHVDSLRAERAVSASSRSDTATLPPNVK